MQIFSNMQEANTFAAQESIDTGKTTLVFQTGAMLYTVAKCTDTVNGIVTGSFRNGRCCGLETIKFVDKGGRLISTVTTHTA